MPKSKINAAAKSRSSASLGCEARRRDIADTLRDSVNATNKHIILGLIFLKYKSDAFEECHRILISQKARGTDPDVHAEYHAACAEGKSVGQFHMPSRMVLLLVEMLTLCNDRIYDPCSRSGAHSSRARSLSRSTPEDRQSDVKAAYVLSNPPFKLSDRNHQDDDSR